MREWIKERNMQLIGTQNLEKKFMKKSFDKIKSTP